MTRRPADREHGVMIALIQRVRRASVDVGGEIVGAIGPGLLAFACVQPGDTPDRIVKMADRLAAYRVFADDGGRMNLGLKDNGGGLLLVSQFTLGADTRSGLRPSFSTSAPPDEARLGFDALVVACRARLPVVETGRFGADMQVSLVNDGPVTFWLAT